MANIIIIIIFKKCCLVHQYSDQNWSTICLWYKMPKWTLHIIQEKQKRRRWRIPKFLIGYRNKNETHLTTNLDQRQKLWRSSNTSHLILCGMSNLINIQLVMYENMERQELTTEIRLPKLSSTWPKWIFLQSKEKEWFSCLVQGISQDSIRLRLFQGRFFHFRKII